jgi:two-component sensor histidine kinase
MKFPKIFLKAFSVIFALSAIYLMFIFLVFIPQIEKNTTTLEDTVGKVELEKTLQIIKSSALELKTYKEMALKQRQDELERLTHVVYNLIRTMYQKSLSDTEATSKIQNETLQLISELQYGNDDYFYVSNYDNVLISHPYLKGKDFSKVRDVYGNLIVPRLVEVAQSEGSGFISYWWKKNTTDPTPYEKLTFAKNFAPWRWVVGTGVYIDDIEKELAVRKKKLLTRLKAVLRSTKIGKSGYIYIFDSSGNMLIHPNTTLEHVNFRFWENPGKQSYIFDDLIQAYQSGDKTLYYNWDTPTDRENYSYKKISWIEYNADFDWYVCSSAYLNEFHQESDDLKRFIIYSAIFINGVLILIGLYFLRQIFNPIVALAKNAKEVSQGDLTARYRGQINNDETGLLATQFNTMLDTINEQIVTLDQSVKSKTQKLTVALEEKEMLLKEISHRVKNNLYVINSIIGLESFKQERQDRDAFITAIQHRIQSMALGHEMLSKSGNLKSLDAKEYIMTLVDSLIHAYVKDPSTCKCIYNIAPIQLDIDKLLSCGLIINELVTNAIKYAFIETDDQLYISLQKRSKSLELVICDSGVGFDPSKKGGIGLELVEMLVDQLEGTISFKFHNGLYISIVFPD